MPGPIIYAVTDIESDGPVPGAQSLLSFASVARSASGEDFGRFTANLLPLPDAKPDPRTMAWWQTQPRAWAAAAKEPIVPSHGIAAYVAWVRGLPGEPVFVAHPLAFDGAWIDWYLRQFAGIRLVKGPYDGPSLFYGAGVDLPSLVMGKTGWDYAKCRRENYPSEWLGGYAHSHCALDDALGYAHLLGVLLRKTG